MASSDAAWPREGGTVALAVGSVLSSVFAYLYIVAGARSYGADEFSGVAQLWTIWFFGASVLTFPLQLWVIQRLRSDGHGGAIRAVLPRLGVISVGLGVAVSVMTLPVRGDLFGHDQLLYPVAAGVITVGSAASGLLRGGLAGRSRFLATGTAMGSENLVRLVLGIAVIRLGAGVGLYGWATVGGLLVILAWPEALRFRGPAPADVSPLAFLGSVAGGTVIAQFVLTGGPVVLSLVGGTPAEVTSLFTSLALFRAPYIIALGLTVKAMAVLTDLAAAGRWDTLEQVRRRTVLGSVALMALGGAAAAMLGPWLLQLIFGDEVDLTRLECAGLAVGSTAALATLAMTLMQMTHGAGGRVLRAWLIGLAVGAVAMFATPLDPLPMVILAFLASELTAFAVMALLDPAPKDASR